MIGGILPNYARNLKIVLQGHARGAIDADELRTEISELEQMALGAVEHYAADDDQLERSKAAIKEITRMATGDGVERYGDSFESYAASAISIANRKPPKPEFGTPAFESQVGGVDMLGEILQRLRMVGPIQERRGIAEYLLELLNRFPDLRRKMSGADLALLSNLRHDLDTHYAAEQAQATLDGLPKAIAEHLAPLVQPTFQVNVPETIVNVHVPEQPPPVVNASFTVPEIPAPVVHANFTAPTSPPQVIHAGMNADEMAALLAALMKPKTKTVVRDANGDIVKVVEE